MRLVLPAPEGFSFSRTVLSHGWCDLPPFRWDGKAEVLGITLALPSGTVPIGMRAKVGGVIVDVRGRPAAPERARIEAAVRRVLQLDLDLTEFHALVAADPALSWIAQKRLGRLLRAPTVFEDLIKLVLTTNCSWSLTKAMVRNLVERYGQPASDGSRAFPGPERLARLSERDWRERVRAGYRSPSLARLCRLVADGDVDPEGWEGSPLEPADLKREILRLPGVGPYVAENLLKFLGRPHGLALDSWMRARYAERFHSGRVVTDRTIGRRLSRLGRWAGLALWFELVGSSLETGHSDNS